MKIIAGENLSIRASDPGLNTGHRFVCKGEDIYPVLQLLREIGYTEVRMIHVGDLNTSYVKPFDYFTKAYAKGTRKPGED
jgi:hypothetical protein